MNMAFAKTFLIDVKKTLHIHNEVYMKCLYKGKKYVET